MPFLYYIKNSERSMTLSIFKTCLLIWVLNVKDRSASRCFVNKDFISELI